MPFDVLSDDDALDPYSARVAHAFERVGPAVAHVAAIDPEGRSRGIGSGVVFTPDGYLLTNNHVVAGAARFLASMPDGQRIKAVPVGYDPATDLAGCVWLSAACLSPNSAARLGCVSVSSSSRSVIL
jgi:S1-C subfamily serine protease